MNNKIKVPRNVNANNQLKAITNYLKNNWDGVEENSEIINIIWQTALERTAHVFDRYVFVDFSEAWLAERHDYTRWKKAGTYIYEADLNQTIRQDKVSQVPSEMLLAANKLSKIVELDYSKQVSAITQDIFDKFPSVQLLQPKSSNSDITFDSKAAKKEFIKVGGFSPKSESNTHFVQQTSLSDVLYNNIEQGISTLQSLVGAIYSHAYTINCNNNNAKMLKDALQMKTKFDSNEYYRKINNDANPRFACKLNQALYTLFKANSKRFDDTDTHVKNLLGMPENYDTFNQKVIKENKVEERVITTGLMVYSDFAKKLEAKLKNDAYIKSIMIPVTHGYYYTEIMNSTLDVLRELAHEQNQDVRLGSVGEIRYKSDINNNVFPSFYESLTTKINLLFYDIGVKDKAEKIADFIVEQINDYAQYSLTHKPDVEANMRTREVYRRLGLL